MQPTTYKRNHRIMGLFSLFPLLLLYFCLPGKLSAQITPTPDCVVFINTTTNGGSASTISVPSGNGFDNRTIGCQFWTFSYQAVTTSGTFTGISVQNTDGALTPGTWGDWSGAVLTGLNPNTNQRGGTATFSTGCVVNVTCNTPNSWERVLITRNNFVGTINGVLYGYKQNPGLSGGGGGGGSGSVVSVTIQGTAGQITASGTCTITVTGTCTLSLPNNVVLPGTINSMTITTSTGTFTLANGKTFTVDNTLRFQATDGTIVVFPDPSGVTTGHCVQVNKTGSTLTFADAGAACGTGGGVTSIQIAGTANQIAVTGTCTITTTGTCTLSLPSNVVLPGTVNSLTLTTSTGTFTLTNAKTFTVNNTLTIQATDGSTVVFPDPSGVTSGHCVQINKTGSVLTLVDAGAACGGSGSPGGVSTDFQINSSGSFGAGNVKQNADGTVVGSKAVTVAAPYVPTYNAAGTTTCDLSQSNECDVTAATGNTTMAFSNPHGSGPYTWVLIQDPATPRTITLPGSANGFCDPSTGSINSRTTIKFHYDGSANYYQDSCNTTDPGISGPEQAEVTTTATGKFYMSFSNTAHTPVYYANNSANRHAMPRVASGDQMAVADLSDASNVVLKNTGNIWSTGAQDFGAVTSLKMRVAAGLTAATNGFFGYDSTNDMLHFAQASADAFVPQFTVTPTNGHCASWVVAGSKYKLGDVACPGGGASIANTLLLIKGDNAGNGVAAAAADVYGLFSGTKDSSHCTAGDGTMQPCASATGGGTVVDVASSCTVNSNCNGSSTNDNGIVFNVTGASVTITLPTTPPAQPFIISVVNANASAATVHRVTSTINGGTSDLSVTQFQGTTIESRPASSDYKANPILAGSSTITVTCTAIACTYTIPNLGITNGLLANNAVGSSKMAVVNTYRTCDISVGDTSGSAITSGQMGPQSRICFIPAAATIVEMDVNADAGTPNVIIGRNRAGTIVNIVSSALATAATGGIACSNTGGTTGLNGATTCSSTLQNTGLNAGDYLELVSGTPGGTAKFFVAHVTYTVN